MKSVDRVSFDDMYMYIVTLYIIFIHDWLVQVLEMTPEEKQWYEEALKYGAKWDTH